MSLQALQDYTYYSKYARWLPHKKRRENWKESIDRIKEMMLIRYEKYNIVDDLNYAYDFSIKKRVLGSQRILQFGGAPVLKHNCRAYNCCASYVDRIKFFQECIYLLLCGCGTGFSVQRSHVDKLPNFSHQRILKQTLPIKKYKINDSIEGWADSIGVLLSSYFDSPVFADYYDAQVRFDYTAIRPKGAYLSSSSGKAPGPEPLKNSIDKIRTLLDSCIELGQIRLKPINAYDIIMHLSDAVLSGGVRRSATICLFSEDDDEMFNAKIGDWFYKNPQRSRSNNSVVLLRDKITYQQFERVIKSTKEFGEPGFCISANENELWNPCFEASLYGITSYGESGWQFCNLCSINGKKIKIKEQFIEFAKAAAIIGTFQAGFTHFKYLGKASEDITRREALLGVSITGVMENPDILLDPDIQKEAALAVRKVNEEIAKKININPAARLTNLKPEGTTSCFLGTSSGIHPHHARQYFRTVQANNTENIFQYFKQRNPTACEDSQWSSNKTDSVIKFCVEVEKSARLKNDLPAIDLLKAVLTTQRHWVEYGTVRERLAMPTLKHNVSNTIQVKPDEWETVAKFIYDNRKDFSGVSLIPYSGDKDYVQAPFCAVHTPKEIVEIYGDASIFASGVIETCLEVFDNLWLACDCCLGLIESKKYQMKAIDKMKKFALRYFQDDIRKMTYCLKDVFNWKLWCDLKREYQDVNYEELVEEQDFTNVEQEVACAGGQCSLL